MVRDQGDPDGHDREERHRPEQEGAAEDARPASEDLAQGFGAHSDQERILEDALYKHVQFFWEATNSIAGSKR